MEKNRINLIKNGVLLAAVVCLGAGFFAVKRDGPGNKSTTSGDSEVMYVYVDGSSSQPDLSDQADTSSYADSGSASEPSRRAEPVWAEVPELTCAGIELGEGRVIFARADGGYALINKESDLIDHVTLSDDDGSEVVLGCSGGEVFITCGGDEITGFNYSGHYIEYAGGVLYCDKSVVEYNDTSFSAYSFNEDYTIECTSVGKYVIRKKDGTVTDSCVIYDDTGLKLIINASDYGFEAVDPDDLLELAVKVNGDLIVTSWDLRVYINGYELVPPGYDAVYSANEEEEDDSEPDSSSLPDDSSEDDAPHYSNVSEEPLTPMVPAAKNGSVSKANEGVSETTLEFLDYVNEVRRQYGLDEVYGLGSLDSVAALRSEELAVDYSHTRPDGSEYKTALDEAGLNWWTCSENIAVTENSAARETFEAWMASAPHRAVILDPKAKYMAIGKTTNSGKEYWCQLFINDVYVP